MDSSIIYRFFFVFLIFVSPVKAIEFQGKFLQGHFILGKTDPNAKILVGKKEVKVSKDGFFVFGIDRDRKFDLTITKIQDGKKEKIIKKVLKRKYNIQRIDGLEESKVTPPESVYKRFKEENNNQPLTDNKASSKKMKRQTKMISLIKNSLDNQSKLDKFNSVIDMAFGLTQKKRFYMSDYGYSNVREVIRGEQDKLIRGQNWDKFYLENIISWWKKKAGKRYDKLKKEGRFRTEVELWTEDDNIQIIR